MALERAKAASVAVSEHLEFTQYNNIDTLGWTSSRIISWDIGFGHFLLASLHCANSRRSQVPWHGRSSVSCSPSQAGFCSKRIARTGSSRVLHFLHKYHPCVFLFLRCWLRRRMWEAFGEEDSWGGRVHAVRTGSSLSTRTAASSTCCDQAVKHFNGKRLLTEV